MDDISRFLDVAKNASLIGGEVLKEYFGSIQVSDIEEKAEKDFVSFVDKTSEAKIVEYISSIFKDHQIVGEEGASINNSPYKWYIDPLDGTKNYLMGFPIFACSVGLVYEDEPIAGAVYLPYFDKLYFAAKGLGAFKNGKPIKVSNRHILKHCNVCYGFPSRSKRDLNSYLQASKELFIEVASMRRPGAAAVDICFLAEGIFDGLMEFELHPWDISGALIVLLEAGGTYSLTNGLKSPTDIVASNGLIHDWMLSVVQKNVGVSYEVSCKR